MDESPPSYVDFGLRGPDLTLLVEEGPGAGESVKVFYGRLHTLDATDFHHSGPPGRAGYRRRRRLRRNGLVRSRHQQHQPGRPADVAALPGVGAGEAGLLSAGAGGPEPTDVPAGATALPAPSISPPAGSTNALTLSDVTGCADKPPPSTLSGSNCRQAPPPRLPSRVHATVEHRRDPRPARPSPYLLWNPHPGAGCAIRLQALRPAHQQRRPAQRLQPVDLPEQGLPLRRSRSLRLRLLRAHGLRPLQQRTGASLSRKQRTTGQPGAATAGSSTPLLAASPTWPRP